MTRLAAIFKWTGVSTIFVMMAVWASIFFFGSEIPYLVPEIGFGIVMLTAIGYAIAWSLEKPPTEEK